MQQGRRHYWILTSAASIVIGFIIWAVINARDSAITRQLPDGSVVTVRVSYGRTVKVPCGNFWQRLAGQILPYTISRRLGIWTERFARGNDTCFVFVETFRTNGTFTRFPKAMGITFNTSVLMSDDIGNEFLLSPLISNFKSGTNTLIEVFSTPFVSHLATRLRLHLVQSDVGQPSHVENSDFVVPNPAPHTKPRWTAGHLPLTNHMDDVTVVLSSIDPLDQVKSDDRTTNRWPGCWPRLLFFENGAPSTAWSVAGFSVRDEDGTVTGVNDKFPRGHFSPLETKEWAIMLQHTFPVRPEDEITFTNIPLAGFSGHDFVPVSADFQGHTVEITRLSRSELDCRIEPSFASRDALLTIAYTNKGGHHETLMKASKIFFGSSGIGFRPFPGGVNSADITFSFPRTTNRFVEFFAHPEPAATNSVLTK